VTARSTLSVIGLRPIGFVANAGPLFFRTFQRRLIAVVPMSAGCSGSPRLSALRWIYNKHCRRSRSGTG
jgi:hypothetical protein